MEACIFCQIIARESPASIFYEDEWVFGLMSIDPVTAGHALIIPRKHAMGLTDLDEETGRKIWTVSQRTAAALRLSGLPCEGVNLFLADGKAAFQTVFHVHMHVFPRFPGDGFRIRTSWHEKPSREELDLAAGQLRQVLCTT